MKSLVILDTVDSTQDEVTRRLKSGAPVDAVLAYEQTAGRGRFGREWSSPKHECLALSFAWHEAENSSWPQGVALAAGLVAAEVFDTSIAWPNDLIAGEKKVGGILTEVVNCSLGRVPVVGIGVNLTMSTPPGGVPWATSLVLEGRPRLMPLDAAAAFLQAIAGQPPPMSFSEIATRWKERDVTPSKRFRIWDGRESEAAWVLEDGSLMVVAGGEEICVTSAEALYGSGS